MYIFGVDTCHNKRCNPSIKRYLNTVDYPRVDLPVKLSVSAKGFLKTLIKFLSLLAAFMVALKLASVPPEKVPFIDLTRPFTRCIGEPNFAIAFLCNSYTPKSNGIESKPHENVILAPVSWAFV